MMATPRTTIARNDELPNDPCRADSISGKRALAFVSLFVVMGASVFFGMFSDSHWQTLLESVLGYTASVMFYGFAPNRNGIPRYLFTCPVVVSQYPRLLRRHALFLAVLIVGVAIALGIHPRSSQWMETPPGGSVIPFYFLVAIPIAALAVTEVFTTKEILERAHLKRAHNDRFGVPSSVDGSAREDIISIFGREQ